MENIILKHMSDRLLVCNSYDLLENYLILVRMGVYECAMKNSDARWVYAQFEASETGSVEIGPDVTLFGRNMIQEIAGMAANHWYGSRVVDTESEYKIVAVLHKTQHIGIENPCEMWADLFLVFENTKQAQEEAAYLMMTR